jgi:predicted RNA-binding Zn-ribbon protein involved in translation (DUF1610 family)
MADTPLSLSEFERRFADEATCAEYLVKARWPNGFVCPGCGGGKSWRLETKSWTYECARCGRETSVTAGTIMQHSKLPLTTWFWAAYVMATQPRGIAALQLQHELGLGSYKTAWMLCAKLRRSMTASDPTPLSGLVEIDKTEIAWRSRNDPGTGGGRRKQEKTVVVGAVEVQDLRLGRIRLSILPDYSATSLQAFLTANLAPGATVKIDERSGSSLTFGTSHDPCVISVTAADKDLPGIHRVFSELEVWALSVHHGLRRHHLQAYLDEFVFRFNHRRRRDAAFLSLLGVAAAHSPLPYDQLVSRGAHARGFGFPQQ